MERRRSGSIIALAVAIAVLAACTSGTSQHADGTTSSPSAYAQVPTRSNDPTTSPSAHEATLKCGNSIGRDAPTAPMQVVLGVVALPTSPGHPALQTSLTGDAGPWRLFAKTGLLVKPGTTFELVVPAGIADRLGIGWGGAPSAPTSKLTVAECPDPGGAGWLAYAGGYWIDRPACVPLIVKAGGKEQQVHIGLGTACPGQLPPQGPTET